MSQPRLRRDIRATPPYQRMRLFFCLKMLSVLPPLASPPRVFQVVWKYTNGQPSYKTITPLNIHDEFIASHQTCCEHGSLFFPYYHRHLLVTLQLVLNLADQLLLSPDQLPPALRQAHPAELSAATAKYKEIISNYRKQLGLASNDPLPAVSLHYWNPTDYVQALAIPEELAQRKPDQMDTLFHAVNRHYPWNFNFATRWFKQTGFIPQGFQDNSYLRQTPAYYSQTQADIITGKLNPRQANPDQFFSTSLDQSGAFLLAQNASEVNAYKNFIKIVDTLNTIDVCTLDHNQLNALFGNKTKSLQWITQAERGKMPNSNSQTRAYSYNKSLPHFQYAYSLFKSSNLFLRNYVSTFNQNFENSMENCHNTMHNNLQRFMSDSQLSITHPVFFLFHSWIDLALQTKIRMIRTGPDNQKEMQAARQFINNIKPKSALDQASQNGSISYANYYIYEWVIPNAKNQPKLKLKTTDYQLAFKSRNFILNEQAGGIRRSDELDPFYKAEYVPLHSAQFAQYKNFAKFIYNYNYEVYDYDPQGKRILTAMQDVTVPVPSYIEAIYKDYQNQWNNNLTRTLTNNPPKIVPKTISVRPAKGDEKPLQSPRKIKDQANQQAPQGQKHSLKHPDQIVQQGQKDEQPLKHNNPVNEQAYYDQKYLLRAIRASFAGFATYSSTMKSTVIPIELQLTEYGLSRIHLSPEHLQIVTQGLIVTVASLLTRGTGAVICPNCPAQKQLWIQCSENIAEMNQGLFCALARSVNRELIYKIQNNETVPIVLPNLTDLTTLTTYRPVFNTLKILQGAREVSFHVTFTGQQDYKSSSIKINGYSHSLQTDKLYNIISKKKENIKCTIQLPQVVGFEEQETPRARYAYRLIKVFIANDYQYQEFQFKIDTYHELIRYQIDVVQKGDKNNKYLDVEVRDMDFAFKEKHYAQNQYDL